jgi:hypothetical protein
LKYFNYVLHQIQLKYAFYPTSFVYLAILRETDLNIQLIELVDVC